MTTIQKAVISLMKAAVTCSPQSLPTDFDICEAVDIIRRHHIHALTYDGAIRCGVDKNHPVMQKLFASYCQSLVKSEGQLKEVERVCKAFEENGIDYMLLKGCKMKKLYPKPELRAMGDADILIRVEQADGVRELMQQLGFVEGKESNHELIWRSENLYLELHKRLIPSYNKDLFSYYGDGWQFAMPIRNHVFTMNVEDEYVYAFTHYAKHFRDGGIGLRHILDLYVYRNSYPQMDFSYIKQQLDKLGLYCFYENTIKLICCWFESETLDPIMQQMSSYIFSSGSWGDAESNAVSMTIRAGGTKFNYIIQSLFPGAKVLEGKYKVLKKAPWLLPVVWMYRFAYKLLFERKSFKRKADLTSSFDKDKVAERNEFLRLLGIEYNF